MKSEQRAGSAGLSPIEDVIADARDGKLFILVDDEDRENEGDLCIIGDGLMPPPSTLWPNMDVD